MTPQPHSYADLGTYPDVETDIDSGTYTDFGTYMRESAGTLVVQPRMGMAHPTDMSAGLRAVAAIGVRAVGTITLDSYTRVGDHDSTRAALRDPAAAGLNGFPLVAHGPATTADVAAAAGRIPVQIRHGSARPQDIFRTLARAGLSVSEGGPVSYCLPYGRTPLAESVGNWRESTRQLADDCAALGRTAHLETFGGCLLGQLCPPSMLVAMSLLEGLFFLQNGVRSISLSYAQQTHPVQDVEALAALGLLAGELIPDGVDWHRVLYTYMGVFPSTEAGAGLLMDRSAALAVRGGVERLIVKTVAEGRRLPTVAENVHALRAAAATAAATAAHGPAADPLPWAAEVDCSEVLTEARILVHTVLDLHEDIGTALLRAFSAGLLDVPFCLHPDNRGLTQGAITENGRLVWARTGRLPLPSRTGGTPRTRVGSTELMRMLRHTAEQHDGSATKAP
ncbi:methylaspartate mutase [Streptomyces sp. NPDC126499]|uniref:methylaspartate mutase n=1 Tax=Streptomyces sp. NPDC126499 TaxID=3155314 RepID=UPI00332FE28E